MKCQKCQFDNAEVFNFCKKCGSKLEIVCQEYGKINALGNVKGGIRTPYVDVPIARLSGLGQPDASIVVSLFGTTRLFDDTTLATLYPDHYTYVTAVENATDAAVQAGFLMPEDGELIKAAAAALPDDPNH